ncbi:hypothetical protein F4823DRAFT_333906 [Ustulina deusta]|nr:hypothetical protein F4823DRAFT_333906 [Ustulina deusta]
MITTTTVPATSTTDVTSSTSALTTKSSTLPEPTPTTGSSSADDSEHTSLSSIPTSSTTVPSTSLESPTGRPADSSTETPKPMANGLSTGAKAGIGVGAGVGGLGLLSLAGFLLYRCGKAASRQDGNGGDTVNRESKTELGGDPVLRSELGGQGLAEMHSDQVIPELWQGHHHDDEWRRQPTELDASDTGRMRT